MSWITICITTKGLRVCSLSLILDVGLNRFTLQSSSSNRSSNRFCGNLVECVFSSIVSTWIQSKVYLKKWALWNDYFFVISLSLIQISSWFITTVEIHIALINWKVKLHVVHDSYKHCICIEIPTSISPWF